MGSSYVQQKGPLPSAIVRTLNNHRGEREPNPASSNFQILDKYKEFILYDSGAHQEDRIIGFGLRELVDELEHQTLVFSDGTFDACPSMFYQLYSFHGRIRNNYPPLIHFLLKKKSAEVYEKMLDAMVQLMPAFNPNIFIVDFENGISAAIRNKFRYSLIKGCYFHLSQSVLRKANELGFKVD